ncbi:nitric oxide-associated protein 1-like [Lingula anatina]|uniref:Nitric oxide-associated protein 1-like n=1 Tax=Lingula anatina TaxID=7574 RepID=A0A1S3KDH0_LINAN|nr:nitric oxide-associated protein 1-like [Lingula anatina]|eukprot:XP_013420504.1 nitric oxide-associated protein 1-like [Lingula anatina]
MKPRIWVKKIIEAENEKKMKRNPPLQMSDPVETLPLIARMKLEKSQESYASYMPDVILEDGRFKGLKGEKGIVDDDNEQQLDPEVKKIKLEYQREELRELKKEIRELEQAPEIMQEEDYTESIQIDDSVYPKRSNKSKLYGGPDPEEPISDVPCTGCGALLHCQDPGVPGYMPSQRYKQLKPEERKAAHCQRCHMMTHFNLALNVQVSPKEYPQIISELKTQKTSLVILLVDLLDLSNSFIDNLWDHIGNQHELIILGNKVDLLPRDYFGWFERIEASFKRHIRKAGLSEGTILHTRLISAKTGYGVEGLVSLIMNKWGTDGNVYLVGCTNVGKSTLFNSLLSSDMCQTKARNLIHRATTSKWPGTTIGTLKFPMARITPWRLQLRSERIRRQEERLKEEEELRKEMWRKYGKRKNLTLTGFIGQTFTTEKPVEDDQEIEPFDCPQYVFSKKSGLEETQSGRKSLEEKKAPKYFDENHYQNSRWCIDTPGLVNPNQIINLLSPAELLELLPKNMIIPRTFVVKPRYSLWLTGLGRIDYLEGEQQIYMTVFANFPLPVEVVGLDLSDQFYRNSIKSGALGLPFGDKDHLNKIPSLVGKEIDLTGVAFNESVADICLSSLGWVAVTAGPYMPVKLRAYTPGGLGCIVRKPLLKFAVNNRGRRISHKSTYKLKKMLPWM